MGITGLKPFLKDLVPECFINLSLDILNGKRLAIDGNNWMYVNMSISRKKVLAYNNPDDENVDTLILEDWLQLLNNFVTKLLAKNITPVFIFDGTHPIDKHATKEKRKLIKTEAYIKAQETDDPDIKRKLLMGCTHIKSYEYHKFLDKLEELGISCITANGDGEQLCSTLAIEGKVSAVLSTDTDNLVYGCPLLVTKVKANEMECIRHDMILYKLGIRHDVFVDLCIMAGCDYNSNIKGYGLKKSLKLLECHKSIDQLSSILDISVLNHIRCRDLFKFRPSYIAASKLNVKTGQANVDPTTGLLPGLAIPPLYFGPLSNISRKFRTAI